MNIPAIRRVPVDPLPVPSPRPRPRPRPRPLGSRHRQVMQIPQTLINELKGENQPCSTSGNRAGSSMVINVKKPGIEPAAAGFYSWVECFVGTGVGGR